MMALAWIFGAAGIAVAVWDLAIGPEGRLRDLGEHWFAIHPDSLQLAQPAVERHVHAALWEGAIQPVLTWPTVYVLFGLAALCLLIRGLVLAARG